MITKADPPIRRWYYWRWTCACGRSGHAETRRAAVRNRNRHWRDCPDPRDGE